MSCRFPTNRSALLTFFARCDSHRPTRSPRAFPDPRIEIRGCYR